MKSFEISIQISLKFLPKGLIDNKSAAYLVYRRIYVEEMS